MISAAGNKSQAYVITKGTLVAQDNKNNPLFKEWK